ncbi:ferredoxin [Lentzea flava]|uniref:Ferredoxin n=1 Tax=Lentzea flava TaxID=103732 RepID=A0ABQ2VEL5_9PSEU|nr:ferredoxin [Lentzea flava]GGU83046.1 hypothetical protein GCM10010178_86890 [Lentzea flava]
MRLKIDRNLCGTTGQCVLIAPMLFRRGSDGIAVVVQPVPPEDEMENAEEAILGCPVQAVADEDG